MRVVLQRVQRAAVRVEGKNVGSISEGLLALVGFQSSDDDQVMAAMADKIVQLRLFEDDEGKMNRSLIDVGGSLLIVSQFTLYGDARKGRRPSYSNSAPADQALALYQRFLCIAAATGIPCAAGEFQAHMEVELINDGPVTILLDSDRLF